MKFELLLAALIATFAWGTIHAEGIILSTHEEPATLGGLTFENGDLVKYDGANNTSTLVFDHNNFVNDRNLDAAHLLLNGHIVLSTKAGAQLGGLQFSDGDLVKYDPVNDSSILFFDESNFSTTADIDAVHVLPGGDIVLSTSGNEILGGLLFRAGDLVRYNPLNNTSTLFFNQDAFAAPADIDAVHVLPGGDIVLSTVADATLAGLAFRPGDLVRYDPVNQTSALFFSQDNFAEPANVDALTAVIPEPATVSLLFCGIAGLAVMAVSRRRPGKAC